VGNKYISKVHNPIIVSTKRKERKNSNKHLALSLYPSVRYQHKPLQA